MMSQLLSSLFNAVASSAPSWVSSEPVVSSSTLNCPNLLVAGAETAPRGNESSRPNPVHPEEVPVILPPTSMPPADAHPTSSDPDPVIPHPAILPDQWESAIRSLGKGIAEGLQKDKKRTPAQLDTFSGDSSAEDTTWNCYARDVKLLQDDYTDAAIKQSILRSLRGIAKKIADGFPDSFTWQEILEELEVRFRNKISYDQLMKEFFVIQQMPQEDILTYASRLEIHLSLLSKNFPERKQQSEVALRERFFYGLQEFYRTNLRFAFNEHHSYSSLLDQARSLEVEPRRTYSDPVSTPDTDTVLNSKEQLHEEVLELKDYLQELTESYLQAQPVDPVPVSDPVLPVQLKKPLKQKKVCSFCKHYEHLLDMDINHSVKNCPRNKEAQSNYWKKITSSQLQSLSDEEQKTSPNWNWIRRRRVLLIQTSQLNLPQIQQKS